MVRSLKWTLFTLWTALPALVRGRLEKRGNATTDVVCQSTYSWMDNRNNQSPCLVAAVLSGVCGTAGGWNVPVLGPGDAYSIPNSTTANACTCSWAVYNLLGACTVCQGSPDVDNWSPYKAGCGSFTMDTYWASNYTVPNNTFLPYWAATDPSKWTGGSFDSGDASSIHSQGKSDINLSASSQSPSSTTKSSSNAGAVAGGIIGGLVAVAGLVALLFYLRHRKRQKSRKLVLLDPLPNTTIHGRSLSDTSQMTVKGTDPIGFSPDFRPTASPPNMYTSNATIPSLPRSHTTSPSLHSLPYDLSIINGPASTSPPPPPPPSQQAMLSFISGGHPHTLENMIVPYTMTSSIPDGSSTDRKRADGNLFPIFEQQNEYQGGPSNNNQPAASRRRMNPPTYNESVTSGEASVIRSLAPSGSVDLKGRGHGHQSSSDTTDSSTTNGNGAESSWTPMPRRTPMVRESAVSGFSGITGIGTDFGPSSVIGVGSAAVTSPTDSQARTNLMSVAGSVVGGDDTIA